MSKIIALKNLPSEHRRCVVFFLLSMFFAALVVGLVEAFFTPYAVIVVGTEAEPADMLMKIFPVGGVVMAFAVAWLAEKFDCRPMMMVEFGIMEVITMLIALISNEAFLMVSMIVTAGGFTMAIFWQSVMLADHSSSETDIQTFISMLVVVSMLSNMVGVSIDDLTTQNIGNNYNMIWLMYAMVFIVSALLLIQVARGEAKNIGETFAG